MTEDRNYLPVEQALKSARGWMDQSLRLDFAWEALIRGEKALPRQEFSPEPHPVDGRDHFFCRDALRVIRHVRLSLREAHPGLTHAFQPFQGQFRDDRSAASRHPRDLQSHLFPGLDEWNRLLATTSDDHSERGRQKKKSQQARNALGA